MAWSTGVPDHHEHQRRRRRVARGHGQQVGGDQALADRGDVVVRPASAPCRGSATASATQLADPGVGGRVRRRPGRASCLASWMPRVSTRLFCCGVDQLGADGVDAGDLAAGEP